MDRFRIRENYLNLFCVCTKSYIFRSIRLTNNFSCINIAQKHGFTLISKSEINANPKDTKDHPRGVWTLPPVLRLKDQDKEKYLNIGESDRMTLLFKKL